METVSQRFHHPSSLLRLLAVVLAVGATPAGALAAWPLFRGTARQLGIASGRLPNRLKLAWKARVGSAMVSSAVVNRGVVYVGSESGQIFALRQKDGKPIWSFKAGGKVEATPCLVGSLVVVGSEDGILYGLDAATGKPRWTYKTDDKILGAANAVPAPGGKGTWLLVGSYDNKVHCVNAGTGKRV
jgi:outer membrane protein assembly factor BamB